MLTKYFRIASAAGGTRPVQVQGYESGYAGRLSYLWDYMQGRDVIGLTPQLVVCRTGRQALALPLARRVYAATDTPGGLIRNTADWNERIGMLRLRAALEQRVPDEQALKTITESLMRTVHPATLNRVRDFQVYRGETIFGDFQYCTLSIADMFTDKSDLAPGTKCASYDGGAEGIYRHREILSFYDCDGLDLTQAKFVERAEMFYAFPPVRPDSGPRGPAPG